MHGYDDYRVLGEYLAAFSEGEDRIGHDYGRAGLGDYGANGYGRAGLGTYRQVGLGALGAARYVPQPLEIGGVKFVAVGVPQLQSFLKPFGAPQTGRIDLQAFPKGADATQKAYVEWQKFSKVTAPLRIAIAEDTKSLEERKADRLTRMATLVMAHPEVAKRVARAATVTPTAPTPTKTTTANVSASTAELQKIMIALGVDPAKIQDGKFGPTTKAKWEALAKSKRLNPFISGRAGATTVTVNRNTATKLRAAAVAAAPVATTDMVANTSDVQSILLRLGFTAPGTALTDGLYGKTTAGFWGEAATKRKLDPFIAKKTADGKQVVVRKETYLKIKADADAKVAPTVPEPVGGGLKTLDPALVARIPLPRFQEVLTRVSGPVAGTVDVVFPKVAAQLKVDPRIDAEPPNIVLVMKTAWAALEKRFQEMEPPKPPPGPERTKLEIATDALVKISTSSIDIKTLRNALNAAILDKKIADKTISTSGTWEPSLRGLLIKAIAPANIPAWESALVVGKLVNKDGTVVKLPPQVAAALKDASAKLQAAKKQAAEVLKGYQEVNPADVIARINTLGVSTKKFDRAGDYKELADAIKTFFENTKTKPPSGDLVRLDNRTKKVFVKNDVMVALASAMQKADERARSTKRFRDSMVASALKSASAVVSVRDFQQAIRHTVLSKQAGKNEALYKAVAVTGAFDKPTRAAYTEIARTQTIGPLVQQYQAMLQQQLGPNFKAALVTEARNQVWNAFLDQGVQKRDGQLSIPVIPAIGQRLASAAAAYRQNTAADKRAAEEAAAQRKVLDEAVKKSTAILSMVNVQQGLLQMATGKSTEATVKPSGVKITGLADKSTRDGLFQLSALIFPEGYSLPETMWVAYLKRAGLKVVAGAKPVSSWASANYISLPPALANKLAKAAGEWIAAHGPSSVQVVAFKSPSVITVTVPKKEAVVDFTQPEKAKEVVEAKKVTAKTSEEEEAARAEAERKRLAAEQAAREKAARDAEEARKRAALAAQEAERQRLEKERAAQAALDAQRAAQEAALREQAARDAGAKEAAERAAAEARQAAAMAQQQAAEAQAALAREQAAKREQAAQQETAAQAGGAQVTGPTITITTPSPAPAPMQAGMGMGGAIALGVGALAALLLSQQGDKKGPQE